MTKEKEAQVEELTTKVSHFSHQLSREREDAGYKLDQSRAEVKTLTTRLAECESHIQQLALNAQQNTRPIVRQLESIQAQHSSAIMNWESLEDSWNNRFQIMSQENSELVARKTASDDSMRELVLFESF